MVQRKKSSGPRRSRRSSRYQWSWRKPLLVGGIFLLLIVLLAFGAVLLQSQNQKIASLNQNLRQTTTYLANHCSGVCHLQTKKQGDILIKYNGDIMVSDGGVLNGHNFPREKTVSGISIPAGKYNVYLESFDSYVGRSQANPADESHEQYYIDFNGVRSGTTEDLPDGVEEAGKITAVNYGSSALQITSPLRQIKVVHAGPKGVKFKHGFEPVCMLLEKVNETPSPQCGNGVLEDGEECDDGNTVSGDGCSSVCQKETSPSPNCGNGTKESGEQCDEGANNGQTCTPAYNSSCTYCSSDCKNVVVQGGKCGDGLKQDSEECDDGNTVSGDGCSSVCQKENTGVRVEKSASATEVKKGETVTYTYRITNTGDTKLTNIQVRDDQLGTITCPQTSLNVGEAMSCTKSVVINQDTTNKVTVTAKLGSKTITDSDQVTVKLKEERKEEEEDCQSSIGNYIWYDTNGNGIQEDIEEGISDVKVCAFRGNKKYCDTTDKHGRYKIKNLCSGHYRVVVKDVENLIPTYDPDGKLDNQTSVKLKEKDEHTKADFGYRRSAPKTGLATNIVLLVLFSTLITVGILAFMKKKGVV